MNFYKFVDVWHTKKGMIKINKQKYINNFSLEFKSRFLISGPWGSATPDYGSIGCEDCDAGTYAPTNGSTQCFNCSKGWANPTPANHLCYECKHLQKLGFLEI